MSVIDKLGGWPAVVGYILGVVGIVATVVAYFRTKVVKTLDWDLILSSPLTPTFSHAPDVEVRVNGDVVANPSVCVVRITNTSNLAISQDEWAGAVSVAFDSTFVKGSVIDASESTVASTAKCAVSSGSSSVAEISDIGLLNPREWFEVQFITSGIAGDPRLSARFNGQTRPMRLAAPYRVPETIGQALLQVVILTLRGPFRL